jgi:hypothetical protein
MKSKSLLSLLLLSSLTLTACTKPKPKANQVQKALIGTWSARPVAPGSSQFTPHTLVFNADGTVIKIENRVAASTKFWLNPAEGPMRFDVDWTEKTPGRNLLAFIDNDTIRVEPGDWRENPPTRATKFSNNGTLYKRQSQKPEVPATLNIRDRTPSAPERQQNGEYYFNTLLDSQRSFYGPNKRFATSVLELLPGYYEEDMNFRYQIIPQQNKQIVVVTAQAKQPDLKSMAGYAYVSQSGGNGVMRCITQAPSTTVPTFVSITQSGNDCGPGSAMN